MKIVTTFPEVREASAGAVGLVPTMGAFHEGHLSHIEASAATDDTVVVSLFVNPLQFDEPADLAAYPRDIGRDTALAEAVGADVLFAPSVDEMYGDGSLTRVRVAEVSDGMEGEHRPGHFDGVATVVAKLFAGVQPGRAYFGRKDAQQLALVRRMAHDLSFPISVVPGPTIREEDGLALSSRNIRLSGSERKAALSLFAGLEAAAGAVEGGEGAGRVLERLAAAPVDAEPGARLEYATLAAQADARPLKGLDEPAFLAMAARVGSTRLIDNVHIDSAGDRWAPDLGVRLDRPSVLYEEA